MRLWPFPRRQTPEKLVRKLAGEIEKELGALQGLIATPGATWSKDQVKRLTDRLASFSSLLEDVRHKDCVPSAQKAAAELRGLDTAILGVF
jgi:hypothetical protein